MSAPVRFSPGRAAALKRAQAEAAEDLDPGQAPEPGDARALALAAIPATGDVILDVDLERALQGSRALRDPTTVSFIRKLVRNTHAQWGEATKAYLRIGEELLEAWERLGHDYDRVVGGRLLPFGKSVETQLRAVAAAVRDGRLPAEGLPGYTTAYRLTQLPPPLLERAKAEGLVRPEVTRREVDEYRSRLARESEASPDSPTSLVKLARERDGLLRRRARLQGEAAVIDARLGEIEVLLRSRDR